MELIKPDGTPLRETAPNLIVPATVRPFDTTFGEEIGNLGDDYVVVPVSRWADTPLIDQAYSVARKVFRRRATNINVVNEQWTADNVLVQEYRRQDRIAVVFAHWARQMGMRKWAWLYHTTVFKIEGDLKRSLILAGRWKDYGSSTDG